jgi:acyl carrier protein
VRIRVGRSLQVLGGGCVSRVLVIGGVRIVGKVCPGPIAPFVFRHSSNPPYPTIMVSAALEQLVHHIRVSRGLPQLMQLSASSDLRRDLGLDSLDLAELTVRIQDRYGVDVFAAGVVRTWGELVQRVQHHIEHGRTS